MHAFTYCCENKKHTHKCYTDTACSQFYLMFHLENTDQYNTLCGKKTNFDYTCSCQGGMSSVQINIMASKTATATTTAIILPTCWL